MRHQVFKHLQAKLAGHLLKYLYEAQDLLNTLYKEKNDKGRRLLTPAIFYEIHQAMLPYCGALTHVIDDRRFRQFCTLLKNTQLPDQLDSVVYARFNLHTKDFYIGETGNFLQRTKTHLAQTIRHEKQADNPCPGCKAHCLYRKHRVVSPPLWITLPLKICANKPERQQIEKWAIRTWKPNMNQNINGFWKFVNQPKIRTLRPRNKGTSHPQRTGRTKKKDCTPTFFTRHDDKEFVNLSDVLTTCHTKECTLTTKRGTTELTHWRRLRKRFGGSTVLFHDQKSKSPLALLKPEDLHERRITITIEETPVDLSWREPKWPR